MPSSQSPSSAVHAARIDLGNRLREIKLEAGLNSVQLAERASWHKSKISRIEKGNQQVTVADIRAWCKACEADDLADDLVASLRTVEGAFVDWRRLDSTGLRRLQESYVPLFERTQWTRVYQSHVVPGLFQTAEYATALMGAIARFRGLPNDVEEAVAARLSRRRVLTSGNHTFAFVIEESVLQHQIGGPAVLAGQLRHLLDTISLPSVSFGVIPSSLARSMWAIEGFTVYDTTQVLVELLSVKVTITAPGELTQYFKAFDELADMAVFGAAAREMITAALEPLESS